jgi:hypothetical protein
MNPSNQKRYMLQLQLANLVRKVKGDKRKGYQYEVVTYDDYQATHSQIQELLQSTLEALEVQSSS